MPLEGFLTLILYFKNICKVSCRLYTQKNQYFLVFHKKHRRYIYWIVVVLIKSLEGHLKVTFLTNCKQNRLSFFAYALCGTNEGSQWIAFQIHRHRFLLSISCDQYSETPWRDLPRLLLFLLLYREFYAIFQSLLRDNAER